MERHSIIVRLNPQDNEKIDVVQEDSVVTDLRFIDGNRRIRYGISRFLDGLAVLGLYPSETALDLGILAAAVTAADTRISRNTASQDSFTREIDLYLPVSDPELWEAHDHRIKVMLRFLTGDDWQVAFRPRQKKLGRLVKRKGRRKMLDVDSVSLFSGGLDSFTGAIDLLSSGKKPLFVSHHRDVSTISQEGCAKALGKVFDDFSDRHLSTNVSFSNRDIEGKSEETTRGRSFIFFALACLAADALSGKTEVYVPENGLISLNVPLDALRIGAWSTRTTHPYYMVLWNKLLSGLGIDASLTNPYQHRTKGEMLIGCKNPALLEASLGITNSCSSMSKSRWKKLKPRQCGYCTPCLIRRASIGFAFGEDPTKYTVNDIRHKVFRRSSAESKSVRAFQLLYHRFSNDPKYAESIIFKNGPLDYSDKKEVSRYLGTFRRGISEVGEYVKDLKVV